VRLLSHAGNADAVRVEGACGLRVEDEGHGEEALDPFCILSDIGPCLLLFLSSPSLMKRTQANRTVDEGSLLSVQRRQGRRGAAKTPRNEQAR
jgi:hypothetical protein